METQQRERHSASRTSRRRPARAQQRATRAPPHPQAMIVYTLKSGINKHFLRRMVEGKLDADLRKTVLIVDEVDDLIVNERPNNHYVKVRMPRRLFRQFPTICAERAVHACMRRSRRVPIRRRTCS